MQREARDAASGLPVNASGVSGFVRVGGWLLATLAWVPAAFAATPPSQAGGATGVPFRVLVVYREDPLSGSRRFDLDAATGQLVRKDKRLRANCPQHWDRRCWDETESRRTLTPAQMDQVSQALAAVSATTRPPIPSTGESGLQLVLDPGETGQRNALSTERSPDASVVRVEAILVEVSAVVR